MAEITIIELQNQDTLLNEDEFPFWRTTTGITSRISFSELKSALGIGDLSLPSQESSINSPSASLNFNNTRIFELTVSVDTTIDAIETDGAFFEDNQIYYLKIIPASQITVSFNSTRFNIPSITTDRPLSIVIISVSPTQAIAVSDPGLTSAIDDLKDGVPPDGDTLNKLYNLIQSVAAVSAVAVDIADRDAQKDSLADQQNIYVADASADPTVDQGWAIYKYIEPTDSFIKISEEENLDVNPILINEVTVNVGGSDVGGYEDGQVIPSGTTFQQFVEGLLIKAVSPNYINPSLVLTISGANVGEVGSQVNLTITPNFNQNDGGSATEYRVSKDSVNLITDSSAPVPESSYPDVLTFIEGSIVYQSEIDYGQGAVKNDNLGNPDPNGRVEAGTTISNEELYTGVYPWFFGVSIDGNVADIDVYAEGSKQVEQIGDFIEANYGSDGFLWFAVPQNSNNPKVYTTWQEIGSAINRGSIGLSSDLFGTPTTKQVTSSGLAANWTEDFDLYITNFSTTAFNARFN